MTYFVLDFDPTTDDFSVLVTEIDNNLNQSGEGPPTGKGAFRPGITYFDELNSNEYVCTEADGTGNPETTTWVQRVYSISDATTTEFGVVQLASSEDVAAGTSTTKAVTPSGLTALARSGNNSDITELLGLTSPLSVAQGGTGVDSIAELIVALFPSFTGEAGEVLTNDGEGDLAWVNYNTQNVQIVNTTRPLTLYAFHFVTNTGLTLTIPTPSNVGDELALVVGSGGVGSTLHTQGSESMFGQTGDITLDDTFALRLVWTGSTNGWVARV